MRHRVNKKRINRDTDHMKSLLMNLSTELIIHEKIETTLAKAKLLKPHIEKMITYAGKAHKSNDKIKKFNAVKTLNKKIGQSEAIKKLIEDISARFSDTPGGYTRIVKVGNRLGDNALLARIEFTKNAPKKTTAKTEKKAKKEEKVEVAEKEENKDAE
ncbi:50S ribosomal protein L17 [candidate division WWE3 bacterium RIFOXYC1_FULL_39_7]|uniref:50S ribosomal protein L17 n=2 Tax=Katanobacteria TaxID=422282 RepID=A0A1F4X8C5_UNCKA|nr:MAG: 50S ribosomal protein L17 [candidate division WWE3 bacterium RIFOXYC1_FULL_39_7]OGC77934.1 MAG: 50S ribosomal protein L17 [candidate division WWE3 bacterium RIFOXYD1_FULL_39_9]